MLDRYAEYRDRLKGCAVCHSAAPPLSRCSGCQQVLYCGREHQREHWAPPGGGGHEAECKELAAVGWAADLAAAAAGFSAIQEAVAIKLWQGRAGIIAQDLGEAARWFRCAIAPRARPTAADAKAQTSASFILGVMLSSGPGTGRAARRGSARGPRAVAQGCRFAARSRVQQPCEPFSLQCGALFASLRRVSIRMPGAARLCAPTRP